LALPPGAASTRVLTNGKARDESMVVCADDTIVAIASAPGGAVRGVIRVSGPGTLQCLQRCFLPAGESDLGAVEGPTLVPGSLSAPAPIGAIPCDLYLWPTERSYTRQPAAELHMVGSPPLLDIGVRTLCQHGARLARPGEFTMRAFLAGRLDLTQAEAVLGVIDARDSQSLQVALAQLAGGLAQPLSQLRADLIDLVAHLEAGLDFVDDDIEFISALQADRQLRQAQTSVEDLLRQICQRGDSAHEPRVVLRGWPNVGKSSLLNALANADAAMVTPHAGTTRDYVTRRFHWQGVSGLLVDTPGFEHAPLSDTLASAAQQAADQQAEVADLELLCLDSTRPLNSWEHRILTVPPGPPRFIVWTKCDLVPPGTERQPNGLYTSSQTGAGLEQLKTAIRRQIEPTVDRAATVVASTAARCRQCLAQAAAGLGRARQLISDRRGEELIVVELREALDNLGQMVGAVYTDDILDRVFGRFCIGK
jgi:tRNA modification GTPase